MENQIPKRQSVTFHLGDRVQMQEQYVKSIGVEPSTKDFFKKNKDARIEKLCIYNFRENKKPIDVQQIQYVGDEIGNNVVATLLGPTGEAIKIGLYCLEKIENN